MLRNYFMEFGMLKILKINSKCFIILLSLVLPLYLFADEPLPGQIIGDPENPQWLKYADDWPIFPMWSWRPGRFFV